MSATASPPRGRTTDELVALMNRHTTQTSARWILSQLGRAGWIEHDGEGGWHATAEAITTFGAIDWEATPWSQ